MAFALGWVLFLGVALWSLDLMSDNARIPSELVAAAHETGVMVCADGTIVHADGSWVERVFGVGRFRCTSWRLRIKLVDPATGATDWPSSPKR